MNVKRFTARNSREAMALVRQAFDVVVEVDHQDRPVGVGQCPGVDKEGNGMIRF